MYDINHECQTFRHPYLSTARYFDTLITIRMSLIYANHLKKYPHLTHIPSWGATTNLSQILNASYRYIFIIWIIELLFVFVEAVFVAPRSKELGIAT